MKVVISNVNYLLLSAIVVTAPLMADAERIPAAKGQYEPTWESLSQRETPDWFRDAKFGIWAHWGPQCQPEAGDWYARCMYEQGGYAYSHHSENYGHPTEEGFMEIMNEWKAPAWDPDKLMELYKKTGARYFMAMGNHHDNMDLWDSPYQQWNSVNIGPKRDILAEWSAAARRHGLPFGVSIHSAHAWTWYEPSQGADKTGDKAGISYDARILTKEDGKGKWWEGLDPQKLYVQNHSLSAPADGNWWDWTEGTSRPSDEYLDNFFNRTTDMIDRYKPDLIYFDDSFAPFWPIDSTGLDVIAHYYNRNSELNGGELNGVVFAKKLTPEMQKALVWDVEKGVLDKPLDQPWQTCTCLGNWHYDRGVYNDNRYKSAKTVISMLVDIVSKNGNMLLSVPVRGDGTIDEKEEKILSEIKAWLDINGEGIFETRPWEKTYGEGPSTLESKPLDGPGFNEGRTTPYTSEDIRFTTKDGYLYAHIMEWPEDDRVLIKSIKDTDIKSVKLLGGKSLSYRSTPDGLLVTLPKSKRPNDISATLKIKLL